MTAQAATDRRTRHLAAVPGRAALKAYHFRGFWLTSAGLPAVVFALLMRDHAIELGGRPQ